jgi:hypothetical protein
MDPSPSEISVAAAKRLLSTASQGRQDLSPRANVGYVFRKNTHLSLTKTMFTKPIVFFSCLMLL